jgi:hypothetical protein
MVWSCVDSLGDRLSRHSFSEYLAYSYRLVSSFVLL